MESIMVNILDINRNRYNRDYTKWYNHYKVDIQLLYKISKLTISYEIFCKYLYDGSRKHISYRTGLKESILI